MSCGAADPVEVIRPASPKKVLPIRWSYTIAHSSCRSLRSDGRPYASCRSESSLHRLDRGIAMGLSHEIVIIDRTAQVKLWSCRGNSHQARQLDQSCGRVLVARGALELAAARVNRCACATRPCRRGCAPRSRRSRCGPVDWCSACRCGFLLRRRRP